MTLYSDEEYRLRKYNMMLGRPIIHSNSKANTSNCQQHLWESIYTV